MNARRIRAHFFGESASLGWDLTLSDQQAGPVIFSLQNGYVWVSGESGSWSIKVGPHEQTLAAMRDFIAQDRAASDLLSGAKKRASLP